VCECVLAGEQGAVWGGVLGNECVKNGADGVLGGWAWANGNENECVCGQQMAVNE